MKKTLLVSLVGIFMAINIFSQTEHKQFIGGCIGFNTSMIGFNSDSLPDISNSNNGVSYIYGYTIKKFAVGAGLDYLHVTQDYENSRIHEIRCSYYMIYPMVRYCYNNGLFIHAQFDLGAGILNKVYDPQTLDQEKQNYLLYGAALGIGYSVKIGERLKIESKYRVLYSYNKPFEDNYNSYDASDALIDFGVFYRFK